MLGKSYHPNQLQYNIFKYYWVCSLYNVTVFPIRPLMSFSTLQRALNLMTHRSLFLNDLEIISSFLKLMSKFKYVLILFSLSFALKASIVAMQTSNFVELGI